jgi:hypothetical protein
VVRLVVVLDTPHFLAHFRPLDKDEWRTPAVPLGSLGVFRLGR